METSSPAGYLSMDVERTQRFLRIYDKYQILI